MGAIATNQQQIYDHLSIQQNGKRKRNYRFLERIFAYKFLL
jgi:hypothetical protein